MLRFSLLWLDHGEVLFESALGVLRFGEVGEEGGEVWEGRVFLCSKSLFFEPKFDTKPVSRFVYKQMGCEPKYSEPANSIVFRTKRVIEIKKSMPYVHRQLASAVSVNLELKHTKASKFCLLIGELFASSKEIYNDLVLPRLKEPFDRSRLVDFREQVLLPKHPEEAIVVEKIEPLVTVYGSALLTDSRIYFQHCRLNNLSGQARQCLHWNLVEVEQVSKRRYLMNEVGLELKTKGFILLLAFESTSYRDEFYVKINELLVQTGPPRITLEEYTRQWQLREMDNFAYLEKLNEFSDRSRMDLTQYPVFPWVVQDYTSKVLDLTSAGTFRDLSKPIGALNEARLKQFQSRYNEMLTMTSHNNGHDEDENNHVPFLYGTHYSTPGFVLFYLIRQRPEEALRLQNGKFDSPDRMFHSLAQTWENCLHSSTDVKELIPEFYEGGGQFLLNSKRLEFGKRQADGAKVNDVELPPWANHSPAEFVRQMRLALESEYVSNHLHLWIDLVFGVDQRNILKHNVFYHLTYPQPPHSSKDGARLQDEVTKRANEAQIMEFGQTPKQLFSQKHPARNHHYEDVVVAAAHVGSSSSGGGGGRGVEDEVERREEDNGLITTTAAWPNTLQHDLMRGGDQVVVSPERDVLGACMLLHANNGNGVAMACGDGSLQFASLGHVSRRVRLSKLALSSVVPTGEGDLLIGSYDNSLSRYSVSTGRVLFCVDDAHEDSVSAISPSLGEQVATSSLDSSVKIWQQDRCVNSFYSHPCPVLDVDLKDHVAVSCDSEGYVQVHDSRMQCGYDPVWQSRFDSAAVEHCRWILGRKIVCSSQASGLGVFDTRMNSTGLVQRVQSAKWSPTCFATDGRGKLLVGDSTGRVTLGSVDGLEQVPFESNVVVRYQSPIIAIQIASPQGWLVATKRTVAISNF
ncbi:hypothetical protein BASA81_003667 [Batrachochytrium salamandrivorans]|nr:hypothetical protein BASA81_003667 [Batrachochytrium salamandrivorans]